MRRAVIGVLMATFAAAAPAAQKAPEAGKAGDGEVVKMRGCVSGSLLKSVRTDPATVVGELTASDRYRMTGSKEVRNQIKKANNALVDVTGRIKAGPQAVVKGKKMGNTTVGIGVTQGMTDTPQMPYTPTIEVDAVEVVSPSCAAS